MSWQQLSIRIPASQLPEAEALLRLAGAGSVVISDDGDTPILEPAPGETPIWPDVNLCALFPATTDTQRLKSLVATVLSVQADLEQVSDEDLEQAARQAIEPTEIGSRLAIVPADHPDQDERNLRLHMGLAFGTGRHPTTRLCLGWLDGMTIRPTQVLDYGCGSGVLAIAAVKLGGGRALAIDNEPQALTATLENVALNDLVDRITVGPPEALRDNDYDLVLANILARPLLDLEETFALSQPPGGTIVLSGILETQIDEIQSCYSSHYESFERRTLDDWGLLTARRNEYDH